MKIRQNLYIDRDLGDALDALVIRRGGNKSRIVNAALPNWLAPRPSTDVDDLLQLRLDPISLYVPSRSPLFLLFLSSLSFFFLSFFLLFLYFFFFFFFFFFFLFF